MTDRLEDYTSTVLPPPDEDEDDVLAVVLAPDIVADGRFNCLVVLCYRPFVHPAD